MPEKDYFAVASATSLPIGSHEVVHPRYASRRVKQASSDGLVTVGNWSVGQFLAHAVMTSPAEFSTTVPILAILRRTPRRTHFLLLLGADETSVFFGGWAVVGADLRRTGRRHRPSRALAESTGAGSRGGSRVPAAPASRSHFDRGDRHLNNHTDAANRAHLDARSPSEARRPPLERAELGPVEPAVARTSPRRSDHRSALRSSEGGGVTGSDCSGSSPTA